MTARRIWIEQEEWYPVLVMYHEENYHDSFVRTEAEIEKLDKLQRKAQNAVKKWQDSLREIYNKRGFSN